MAPTLAASVSLARPQAVLSTHSRALPATHGPPPIARHSWPAPHVEAAYGRLLAPYLEDPGSLFIVSSDFCHWGRRFGYTYHDPKQVGGALLAGLETWWELRSVWSMSASVHAPVGSRAFQAGQRACILLCALIPPSPCGQHSHLRLPLPMTRAPSMHPSRRWTGRAWH